MSAPISRTSIAASNHIPASFVPLSVGNAPRSAPHGWRWKRLTSIAKLESGHTPSRYHPEWWGGDIPWLALPDIRELDGRVAMETSEFTNEQGIEHSSARVLPADTVCLSRTASVGFVTIMGRPMATSQDFVNWVCGSELDAEFLLLLLMASRRYIRSLSSGAIHKTVYMPTVNAFEVCIPSPSEQKRIAKIVQEQLSGVERARAASKIALDEAIGLPGAFVRESIRNNQTCRRSLRDCLIEVKNGVGDGWGDYPVLGATRDGIAPAKEGVGKAPGRYKLVDPTTVFYNPMRILLGSIAMVDEGDGAGITSPDYVVVKGRPGILDTRWFYYWFRSALGDELIQSLSRGAVRERILFNRLAAGEIETPDWEVQVVASEQMKKTRILVERIADELKMIEAMPTAILRRAFSGGI